MLYNIFPTLIISYILEIWNRKTEVKSRHFSVFIFFFSLLSLLLLLLLLLLFIIIIVIIIIIIFK